VKIGSIFASLIWNGGGQPGRARGQLFGIVSGFVMPLGANSASMILMITAGTLRKRFTWSTDLGGQ
jgi:hypothetical protein